MKLKKIFTIGFILTLFSFIVSCGKEIKITLTQDKAEVFVGDSVDYVKYFSIKENDTEITVTLDMIDASKVDLTKAGEYAAVLTYKKNTASLPVHVSDRVEIAKTNANNVMELNGSLDYKTLFTIKVNNQAVTVLDDMIDSSKVNKAVPGTYMVKLTYSLQNKNYTLEAPVIVNAPDVILITVVNSNPVLKLGDEMDYTKLFKITKNGTEIPVTADMLDLSKVKNEPGVYPITITYLENTKNVTLRVIDPTDELESAFQLLNYNYTLVFSGISDYEFSLKMTEQGYAIKTIVNDITRYLTYESEINQAYNIEKAGEKWVKDTTSSLNLVYYLEIFDYIDVSMIEYRDGKYMVTDEYLQDVMYYLLPSTGDLSATEIEFVLKDNQIFEINLTTSNGLIKVQLKDLNAVSFEVPQAEMKDLLDRLPVLKEYAGEGQTTDTALEQALQANYINNVASRVQINWMNSLQEQSLNLSSNTTDKNRGVVYSETENIRYSYLFDQMANSFLVQYLNYSNNENGYDFYTPEEMLKYGLRFNFDAINAVKKAYFKADNDYFVAKDIKLFSGAFNKFFQEILTFYIMDDYTASEEYVIDDFAMKIQNNRIVYLAGRLKLVLEDSVEYYTVKIEFLHDQENLPDLDISNVSSLDRLMANLQLNPNYSVQYNFLKDGTTHSLKMNFYDKVVIYEYTDAKYAVVIEPVYFYGYYLGDEIKVYKAVNNFWVLQETGELENVNEINLPTLNFSYLVQKEESVYEYLSSYFTQTGSTYTTNSKEIIQMMFGQIIGLNLENGNLASMGLDADLIQNLVITTDNSKISSMILTLTTGVLTLNFGTVASYPYPENGHQIYGELHNLGVEGVGSQNVEDLNIAVSNLKNFKFQQALAMYTNDTYKRDLYEYLIGDKGVYAAAEDFYYQFLDKYNTYFGYQLSQEMYDYYSAKELMEFGILFDLNLNVLDKANFVSSEDGYFRAKNETYANALATELFGDLTANGKYALTIKDFVVKVVDQKLVYIGVDLTRTNGTQEEAYVLEYFFSEHDNIDLTELENLAVQVVEEYPLEPALVKLTDYIFKVELTVTLNNVSQKIVMAYSENYTLYTFEDGTEIYVEFFGEYYEVYTKVNGKWQKEEIADLASIGLPEVYLISHYYPNGDEFAYVYDYFTLNAQNEYACESEVSYFFALYFMLLYTVYDGQVVEFENTDVTKFVYKLNDQGFLDEILINVKGYILSYKFFESEKFKLPSIVEVPVIEDDNTDTGSQDIADLNQAISNGFGNYKVNHTYSIISANGNVQTQSTIFYTDGNKFIMEFIGDDGLTYISYYLYKGDFIVDQYDKDENGLWVLNKDQDIQAALYYGLIPYFYYPNLANHTFTVKDGYFTSTEAISVFCDIYGMNPEAFSNAIDFRIKVVGQRIVKVMAVMKSVDGDYLVYNITLSDYDEISINLPNELDIAYQELAYSNKYTTTVAVDFKGTLETVLIEYANGKYRFVFSDQTEAFYDSDTNKFYINMYGQWMDMDLGDNTLAKELGLTLLYLTKKFEEGWTDPVQLLMSELFTASAGNPNLYLANSDQLMYVGDTLLTNGLGFDYSEVNHFSLTYHEISMELKDGKLYQIIIRIGDYTITSTYGVFDGDVTLPSEGTDPENPTDPDVTLDDLTAGMLDTAKSNVFTSYKIEVVMKDSYGEATVTYTIDGNKIKVDDPSYGGMTYIVLGETKSLKYTESKGVWSAKEVDNSTLAMQYFLGFDWTQLTESDYTIQNQHFVSSEAGYEKIAENFTSFWSSATQISIGLIAGNIAQLVLVDNYATITMNYSGFNQSPIELPTIA